MPEELEGGVEGWTVYRKLILAELVRLTGEVAACNAKIDGLRNTEMRQIWTEITTLKVKAATGGFVAGLGGSLIVGIILYFITKPH